MASPFNSAEELRLGHPPRTLTPGMKRYLARKRSWIKYLLLFTLALPGGILLVVSSQVPMAPAFIRYMGLGFIGLAVLIYLIAVVVESRKVVKLRQVMREGRVEEVTVMSIEHDFNVRMNDRPRTVIHLDIRGEEVVIRTFDGVVVKAFAGQKRAQILYWDGAPGVLVPVKALQEMEEPRQTRPKPRRMDV